MSALRHRRKRGDAVTDSEALDMFYALLMIVTDADKAKLDAAWWTGKTDESALLELALDYGLIEVVTP